MSESLSALLYLVAAICFIMALRGLSSPEAARGGNIFGIVGMVIAILTTLASPEVVSYWLIVIGIVIGGAVGAYIARQIQMTALPQLVAAFHSLVGLAAVCVAAAAFAAPEAYGIGIRGAIHPASLVEMAIGLTIGAITFTGSIVAFAKLQGLVSGRPLTFAGQHPIDHPCDSGRVRHRERRRGGGRRGGRPAGQIGERRRRGLHPEKCRLGHHRARLRHGGGAGAARASRNGRHSEKRRGQGQLC